MGYAGLRLFSIFAMCVSYCSEAYFFVPQEHFSQGAEDIEFGGFVFAKNVEYTHFKGLDFKNRKYKDDAYFFDRAGIDEGALKGIGGLFANHYRECETSFSNVTYSRGFDCSDWKCGECLNDFSHYDKALCHYDGLVGCSTARPAVSYKIGDQLINAEEIKKSKCFFENGRLSVINILCAACNHNRLSLNA
ncbi:hypothetical protein FFI16_004505 [Pseudomonas sp. KBS0710]|uniref:hypothetical protein n=1 Tax=Pseudomonas sp. KBS0710 TaxID=1179667 RepID=UPI00110E7522|nr:hypothetical protein [Pseudomonas sp. KBS0710]TSD75708.1 hypothetical protein FFI16_004505 [Pseudomonas sp. KBS0710]